MAGVSLTSRYGRFMLTWPLWPQALLFFTFFLIPLVFIALTSVMTKDGGVTASNYVTFLLDSFNRDVIVRTLAIGTATTILTLILGYPLARAITRGSRATRWFLSGMVFFPLLTSSVVRSFGWLVLLGNNGLLNNFLHFIGLPPVHLIFNAYGVTIALAQVLLPFMVLNLVSAMANVDPAIEEAASTLGSSSPRRFFRVTLPMLVPGILSGSLLVFAISISSFVTPALVGGPRTTVMATLIYTSAMQTGNLGLASACSLILLVLTFLIVMTYYRILQSVDHAQRESKA